MNYISESDLFGVRETKQAGLGIFARCDILKDTVLERAVAIPIFERERWIIEATMLWEYYFVSRDIKQHPYVCGFVVFGISSLCNHAASANAEMAWRTKGAVTWADLYTTRDIRPDEEIAIHYRNIDEYVGYGKIPSEVAYGHKAVDVVAG